MARRAPRQGGVTIAKARSWSEVRAAATAAGLIDEKDVDEARGKLHDMVRAQRLIEVH